MSQINRYTTTRGQRLLQGHRLTDSVYQSNPTNYSQNKYPQQQNQYLSDQQYNNPLYPRVSYQQPKFQTYKSQYQRSPSQAKLQQKSSCCSCKCCCLALCGILLLLIILVGVAIGVFYYLGYLKFNINLSLEKPGESTFNIRFQTPEHSQGKIFQRNFDNQHDSNIDLTTKQPISKYQDQILNSDNKILQNQLTNSLTNEYTTISKKCSKHLHRFSSS